MANDNKGRKRTLAAVLLAMFLIVMAAGVFSGELRLIRTLGSFICFECIGLG